MALQLYIGNKNYSSWSLRPWLLMRELGLAFDEVALRFDFSPGSPFREAVARVSPAGRVPVLVDDGFAVWDTLAIAEYLHEEFPAAGVWPAAPHERARARSLCAEMHSGFGALRQHCPMNIEARLPEVGRRLMAEREDVRGDLQRIDRMWSEQLAASGGPMLFGRFSAVDAFYAPVCSRIDTHALPLSDAAAAYVQRVLALPGMRAWTEAALAEHDFIAEDDPYRPAPG
ncbi:MAG TPA: glutathione S-transferase family protein [Rubrivivax sp.]|nr:glutathione S-transferase family protein [Rubrivivax sp.]